MRNLFIALFVLISQFLIAQNTGSVGIGTLNPDTSAVLHLESSNQGFLMVRTNTAGLGNINNPADGLIVYNTDDKCYYFFNNTTWKPICETRTDSVIGIIGQFDTLYANYAYIDSIVATYISVDSIIAQWANFDSIFAYYGNIQYLYSTVINTDSLFAYFGQFDSLVVNQAYFDSIFANYIQTQVIYGDTAYFNYANIDTLFSQWLNADSIFANYIYSDTIIAQYGSFDTLIVGGIGIDSLIWQYVSPLYDSIADINNHLQQIDSTLLQKWDLNGNTITGSNFLGTLNNQPLIFKTNNTVRGGISNSGAFYIQGNSGTTPLSGTGTKFMWIPSKQAFRVGYSFNTEWDNANIGQGSTVIGSGGNVSGNNSILFGSGGQITGNNSIVIGWEYAV